MGSRHGTVSRSNNQGCRCARCRRASTEYHRAAIARLRTVPRKQVPHGTLNGYNNYACRCDECKAANAARSREDYRARRRGAV